MAKYKSLPNYALTRNGKTIVFDIDGIYETNVQTQVELLDGLQPFIKRIDEVKPKENPKPKTQSKDAKKK